MNSLMNRSELIAALAKRFPSLTRQDVYISVAAILNGISDELAKGGRAEIRGFGSFRLNICPPRIGHNPKTGERVSVPAKAKPNFKPGVDLKRRVNTID